MDLRIYFVYILSKYIIVKLYVIYTNRLVFRCIIVVLYKALNESENEKRVERGRRI